MLINVIVILLLNSFLSLSCLVFLMIYFDSIFLLISIHNKSAIEDHLNVIS
jgi:hypothetical protein